MSRLRDRPQDFTDALGTGHYLREGGYKMVSGVSLLLLVQKGGTEKVLAMLKGAYSRGKTSFGVV